MSNTNKSVAERFQAIIEHYDLSTPSFSKELGFERADKIYNIVNGKFNPSYDILLAITNKFVDINIDWLISGRGKMLLGDQNTKEVFENINDSELREDIVNKLCQLSAENALLKNELEEYKGKKNVSTKDNKRSTQAPLEPKLK